MSKSSKVPRFPVRAAVDRKLVELIEGRISRAEAEIWAQKIWDNDEHVKVTDWPAWDAVKNLTAADLKDAPNDCAYELSDFVKWLDTLRQAPVPSP